MRWQVGEQSEFRLLRELEAAKVLGVSLRSLQQYRLDGRGPEYVQIMDRRIGYTMEALQEWVKGRVRRNTSDKGEAA